MNQPQAESPVINPQSIEDKVQVLAKTNYGTVMFYPHNKQAQRFADLIGNKTLSRKDLDLIHQMGFEVQEITMTFL